MTASLMAYFIVCPLVFLAGFVDAVAGGGGLISLPAYLIAGVPVHTAIGTNKISSGMGTALATWRFHKSGYIPWKTALLCAACGLAGARGGAKLALLLSDDIFKIVMLIILPLTAIYVLKGKSLAENQERLSPRKTLILSMTASFVLGIYDGFYGPGTGTFLLLLFTGLAKIPLKEANGIAKTVNLTTNLSALAVFAVRGKIMISLGLTAGLFSLAGSYMGTIYFSKGGAKAVKPVIIMVLSIFFIKTLCEIL